MSEDTREAIQNLFSSTDPADLLRGLALVEAAAPSAGPWERQTLCDMVVPLFYIDTLDHPEHMPVVERAIDVIAGMGEAAIPVLFENIDAGDVKADIAMAQALGLMGPSVIDVLIARYESGCGDPSCRAFLLFALGKIRSPEVLKAAPLVIEAAGSVELELRDTATRAIGKFVEVHPFRRLTRRDPRRLRDPVAASPGGHQPGRARQSGAQPRQVSQIRPPYRGSARPVQGHRGAHPGP